MVEVARVHGKGWRHRWSAQARVSAHGSVSASAWSKRSARRKLMELTGGREYVPMPRQRVLPGTRPRWPLVGQRIEEIGTGLVFEWDGARWVG